jgi:hypothetical protein
VYEERTEFPFTGRRGANKIPGSGKMTQAGQLSTLARWLKSLLGKAGIDTGIFKFHSVRGAATSAAANADILKAGDWSSESVF